MITFDMTDNSPRTGAMLRFVDTLDTLYSDGMLAGGMMMAEGASDEQLLAFAYIVSDIESAAEGLRLFLGLPVEEDI